MNKFWFKIFVLVIIIISLSLVSLSILAQVESDKLLKELLKGKTETGLDIVCPSYESETETAVTKRDKCSGLVWASKELPTAKVATDPNPGYTWQQATDSCANLLKDNNGKSLFRLPTVEELLTIVKYSCDDTACSVGASFGANQQPVFASGIYWTINDYNETASWTVNNPGRDYKRSVNLLNGEVDSPIFGQSFKLNALCIVDRQPEIISKFFTTVTTTAIDNGQAATSGNLKIRYNRQCTTDTATAECTDKGVGTSCDFGYCAQEETVNFSTTPIVASCSSGYHVEGQTCQPDSADAGNKFWYGSLVNGLMDSCYNTNYHRDPVTHLCALNYRSCDYTAWYPNITAEQQWISGAWSACAVTQCVSSAIDNDEAWPAKTCTCQSDEFFDGEKCNNQRTVSCETRLVGTNPELALTAEKTWSDSTHQYSACYAKTCIQPEPTLILSGAATEKYCTCPVADQHFENGQCQADILPCTDIYINPEYAATAQKIWLPATKQWSSCYALTCKTGMEMIGSLPAHDTYCQCPSDKHAESNVCVNDVETCALTSTDKVCTDSSAANGKECATSADCAGGTCELATDAVSNFDYANSFQRRWGNKTIGQCSGGEKNTLPCAVNYQCYYCDGYTSPVLISDLQQCFGSFDNGCAPQSCVTNISGSDISCNTTSGNVTVGWTQCFATSCKAGYSLNSGDPNTYEDNVCDSIFYVISGQVKTAVGNLPVAGATITVTKSGTVGSKILTTAADGSYNFTDVTNGTYTLQVSRTDYQTSSAVIVIVNGASMVQNFQLTPVTTTFTITNTTASALTDYQVKFNYSGISTVLYVANSSALLSYWIDTSKSPKEVWVKVPSIPASNSTPIYVSDKVTSAPAVDPLNTFLLFDDFSDSARSGPFGSVWSYYNVSPSNWVIGKCQANVAISGGELSIQASTLGTQDGMNCADTAARTYNKLGYISQQSFSNNFRVFSKFRISQCPSPCFYKASFGVGDQMSITDNGAKLSYWPTGGPWTTLYTFSPALSPVLAKTQFEERVHDNKVEFYVNNIKKTERIIGGAYNDVLHFNMTGNNPGVSLFQAAYDDVIVTKFVEPPPTVSPATY